MLRSNQSPPANLTNFCSELAWAPSVYTWRNCAGLSSSSPAPLGDDADRAIELDRALDHPLSIEGAAIGAERKQRSAIGLGLVVIAQVQLASSLAR